MSVLLKSIYLIMKLIIIFYLKVTLNYTILDDTFVLEGRDPFNYYWSIIYLRKKLLDIREGHFIRKDKDKYFIYSSGRINDYIKSDL